MTLGLGRGRDKQTGVNRFDHRIESVVDVVVREPNHPKTTLPFAPMHSSFIVLFLCSVRVTVHLDDELGCAGNEASWA
jgi:hypothetical protein